MPTYEYRCNACKRELEVQQKMADDDLTHCTSCHEDKLERLISWTSVRSDTWQESLYKNPAEIKQSLKGTAAVDTSKPIRSSSAATALDESFVPCNDACARSAAAERAAIKR